MSETKDMLLPWFLDSERFEGPTIYASGRGLIATTGEPGDGSSIAYARFIVQACNAHEGLVKALETCITLMADYAPKMWGPEIAKARDAIAKAETA